MCNHVVMHACSVRWDSRSSSLDLVLAIHLKKLAVVLHLLWRATPCFLRRMTISNTHLKEHVMHDNVAHA